MLRFAVWFSYSATMHVFAKTADWYITIVYFHVCLLHVLTKSLFRENTRTIQILIKSISLLYYQNNLPTCLLKNTIVTVDVQKSIAVSNNVQHGSGDVNRHTSESFIITSWFDCSSWTTFYLIMMIIRFFTNEIFYNVKDNKYIYGHVRYMYISM